MTIIMLCRSKGYKEGQIISLTTSRALELIELGIAEEFDSEKFCYSNRMAKILRTKEEKC